MAAYAIATPIFSGALPSTTDEQTVRLDPCMLPEDTVFLQFTASRNTELVVTVTKDGNPVTMFIVRDGNPGYLGMKYIHGAEISITIRSLNGEPTAANITAWTYLSAELREADDIYRESCASVPPTPGLSVTT